MPLYRIHANDSEAVDLNVWGPRGYHSQPDYETVQPDHAGWVPISRIEKTTRDHAALLLRWARRHGVRVERFRR